MMDCFRDKERKRAGRQGEGGRRGEEGGGGGRSRASPGGRRQVPRFAAQRGVALSRGPGSDTLSANEEPRRLMDMLGSH